MTVRLISPLGEIVEVECVADLCRKYGLDQGNMSNVIAGARQHHKGWRCADVPPGSFERKPYAIERYLKR